MLKSVLFLTLHQMKRQEYHTHRDLFQVICHLVIHHIHVFVGLSFLCSALLIHSEDSASLNAFLEACKAEMCSPTLALTVVPSRAGNLSANTEGRLGFCPNTYWYGL